MEGMILGSLINLIDKYHSQLTVLLIGLALIILTVIFWVWFYNRKKYHNLKHQIPASIVKNYLDTIIQNSTSLKSSLFRGGGLDVEGGIPSVFPLADLQNGAQVSLDTGDIKELKAIIDKLQNQLVDKNHVVRDLENQNSDLNTDGKNKASRILELEGLLKQARSGQDNSKQLESLEATNAILKEELKQFEMIADDLADLKELKKENAYLRSLLKDQGVEIPDSKQEKISAPEENVNTDIDDEEEEEEDTFNDITAEELESFGSEAADENEIQMGSDKGIEEIDITQMIEEGVSEAKGEVKEVEASSEQEDSDDEDDSPQKVEAKSPEDLLEEFEKMLS